MKQFKSIEKNIPYWKYYDEHKSLPIASGNIQLIYREALQAAIQDEFGKPNNEIDKIDIIQFEYEFLNEAINWLTVTFHEELNYSFMRTTKKIMIFLVEPPDFSNASVIFVCILNTMIISRIQKNKFRSLFMNQTNS